MPELSEVRWLTTNLQCLIGAKILASQVLRGECILYEDVLYETSKKAEESFNAIFGGSTITAVTNKAKFVITQAKTSEGKEPVILTHLGFTGWWVPDWANVSKPRKFIHNLSFNHSRLIIKTDRGSLYYLDPRLLGRNRIYTSLERAKGSRHLINMAPEADTFEGISSLQEALKKTRRRVRDVLLDQQILSGIGNYYLVQKRRH